MNWIAADRADQERTRTEESTKEFLAEALKDFDKFASLVEIITKKNERTRFVPNRIQRLYSAKRTARDIILKARQQGMTTVEQIRDVFYFLTVPGARVVVVCQSVTDNGPLKQLTQNFQVMLDSLRRAGMDLEFTTEAVGHWVLKDRDSSLKVTVSGASETSASKKGRAGTISRLHITECAFFEFADSTLNAMLECVPSPQFGSQIVIESTANGAAGFFYRQCEAAKAKQGSYKFHFFPWHFTEEYSTPLEPGEVFAPSDEREAQLLAEGVTPEQLKWYRDKVTDKGADKTTQEYPTDPETCFLVSGRQFFDPQRTIVLIAGKRVPIETRDRERIRIYRRPEPGKIFLLTGDTSEGSGQDSSAGVLRDFETNELYAVLHGQYTPWQLAEALDTLGREYNYAVVVVERNNHGRSTLDALINKFFYENLYFAADEKAGWLTSPITRPVMLDSLEDGHRQGFWSTPDEPTLSQVRNFVIAKSGKPQAKAGEHDDLVIAEAICWAVRPTINIDMSVGGATGAGWRR